MAHGKDLSLSTERSAYGLRSNDFAKYHAHCSRKVKTLRQKLKVTNGKGREFKKAPAVLPEQLTNDHERAWSHSEEITHLPAAAEDRTLRHRATGRYRRAVQHSHTLLSQAKSMHSDKCLSASSLIQIVVYDLIVEARFQLRRDAFEPALERFSAAWTILSDVLIKGATTSRAQALYTMFAEEISPQIRYCAHSLKKDNAHDIPKIARAVSATSLKQLMPDYDTLAKSVAAERQGRAQSSTSDILRDQIWEGSPTAIQNPELVDALLKVQHAEDSLSQQSAKSAKPTGGQDPVDAKPKQSARSKVQNYDAVLLSLTDAEALAKQLVDARDLGNSSSVPSGSGRDISFVYEFIRYRLLSRRIERDLLLVDSLLIPAPSSSRSAKLRRTGSTSGSSKDPRIFPALVKVYDTIVQSLEQMRNLSIVEESAELGPRLDGIMAFSRAKRVLYLSHSYLSNTRYAEALSLTAKAQLDLREARSRLEMTDIDNSDSSSDPTAFYPLSLNQIDKEVESLSSEERKAKLAWFDAQTSTKFVKNELGVDSKTSSQPSAEGSVVTKKPTFYDVAFNYVELPIDRLNARGKKQASASPTITTATSAPLTKPSMSSPTSKKTTKSKTVVDDEEPKVPDVKIVDSSNGASGGWGILGGWWGGGRK